MGSPEAAHAKVRIIPAPVIADAPVAARLTPVAAQ
jgi:hypothetical protein